MNKPCSLSIDQLSQLVGAKPPTSVIVLHPDNLPLLEAAVRRAEMRVAFLTGVGESLRLSGIPVRSLPEIPRVDPDGHPCVYFLPNLDAYSVEYSSDAL